MALGRNDDGLRYERWCNDGIGSMGRDINWDGLVVALKALNSDASDGILTSQKRLTPDDDGTTANKMSRKDVLDF